jgi:hypothetical protein
MTYGGDTQDRPSQTTAKIASATIVSRGNRKASFRENTAKDFEPMGSISVTITYQHDALHFFEAVFSLYVAHAYRFEKVELLSSSAFDHGL